LQKGCNAKNASCIRLKKGSIDVVLFGVAAERNKREMKVRKRMNPQQDDDARSSVDPFSFRTDKTLTESITGRALFITIV
jgi:hypothetical protein